MLLIHMYQFHEVFQISLDVVQLSSVDSSPRLSKFKAELSRDDHDHADHYCIRGRVGGESLLSGAYIQGFAYFNIAALENTDISVGP